MYYPYFRGKQYELITIRESVELLSQSNFTPVIEPVKQSLNALQRTICAIRDGGARAIVLVNPHHGDLSTGAEGISELLAGECMNYEGIFVGVLLKQNAHLDDIVRTCEEHANHQLALIHAGFTDGKGLSSRLSGLSISEHLFFDGLSGKLYQKHFSNASRILLRDGFERRRNRDHPPVEFFSDLHATFQDEGMDGFGDFLIVGDDYSESGGPAYAVAIHLTFIDQSKDDEMHIYHFVSDRQDTPTDPAGKFKEALNKLIIKLDSGNSKLLETSAIKEFREFHKRGHFPGLGYVKKLSMKHHIETLASYFANQP